MNWKNLEKEDNMINFIICEDEDVLASKYINVIDNVSKAGIAEKLRRIK